MVNFDRSFRNSLSAPAAIIILIALVAIGFGLAFYFNKINPDQIPSEPLPFETQDWQEATSTKFKVKFRLPSNIDLIEELIYSETSETYNLTYQGKTVSFASITLSQVSGDYDETISKIDPEFQKETIRLDNGQEATKYKLVEFSVLQRKVANTNFTIRYPGSQNETLLAEIISTAFTTQEH